MRTNSMAVVVMALIGCRQDTTFSCLDTDTVEDTDVVADTDVLEIGPAKLDVFFTTALSSRTEFRITPGAQDVGLGAVLFVSQDDRPITVTHIEMSLNVNDTLEVFGQYEAGHSNDVVGSDYVESCRLIDYAGQTVYAEAVPTPEGALIFDPVGLVVGGFGEGLAPVVLCDFVDRQPVGTMDGFAVEVNGVILAEDETGAEAEIWVWADNGLPNPQVAAILTTEDFAYVSLIGGAPVDVLPLARDVDFGELKIGTALNSPFSLDRVRLQLAIGPGEEPFNGFYLGTNNVVVAADYVENCRLISASTGIEFARGVNPSHNTGAITWDVMTDDLTTSGGGFDPFVFRVVCDISDAPTPQDLTAVAIVLLQPEEFGIWMGNGIGHTTPTVYADNNYPTPWFAAVLIAN